MQFGTVARPTYSSIQPSPGHFYAEEMPTEERIASEWNHIFGASHATMHPNHLEVEFAHFVKIPVTNRLQPGDMEALLALITESETIIVIAQLPRFKAGGTTGLLQRFCSRVDTRLDELVQRHSQRGGMTKSFLQATSIQLRNSADAMDDWSIEYRL